MQSNLLAAFAAVKTSMFSDPPYVLPPTGRGNFNANRIVANCDAQGYRCAGLSGRVLKT